MTISLGILLCWLAWKTAKGSILMRQELVVVGISNHAYGFFLMFSALLEVALLAGHFNGV